MPEISAAHLTANISAPWTLPPGAAAPLALPCLLFGADICSLQSEVAIRTPFCPRRLVPKSNKCDIAAVISNWSAEVFIASLGGVQTSTNVAARTPPDMPLY